MRLIANLSTSSKLDRNLAIKVLVKISFKFSRAWLAMIDGSPTARNWLLRLLGFAGKTSTVTQKAASVLSIVPLFIYPITPKFSFKAEKISILGALEYSRGVCPQSRN